MNSVFMTETTKLERPFLFPSIFPYVPAKTIFEEEHVFVKTTLLSKSILISYIRFSVYLACCLSGYLYLPVPLPTVKYLKFGSLDLMFFCLRCHGIEFLSLSCSYAWNIK